MSDYSEALAVALQHHEAGQLRVAEQIYRQILAADPHQAAALHLLGVIAYQMRQYEAAALHIARAIELKSSEPAFHNNLGNVFYAQGKWAEASAAYQRALELKPDYAEAYSNLGNAFQAQGKRSAALRYDLPKRF